MNRSPRSRDKHNVLEEAFDTLTMNHLRSISGVILYSGSAVPPFQITSVQEKYFNLEIIEEF